MSNPGALSILLLGSMFVGHAYGDACVSGRGIGVDLSEWDDSAFGYDGRAVVQTFFAEDTLISAITVWRSYGEDSSYNGIHLMIGETDSTGMPVTSEILFNGPVLKVFGDGANPIEYRYEFNPPIAVPRRDTFAVYFISNPCDGTFNLYLAQDTEYAGGSYWRTYRGGVPCGLRPYPLRAWEWDLCFRLEFCDTVTPVRRSTWGQLKQRYR